jgi:hypothetical protein
VLEIGYKIKGRYKGRSLVKSHDLGTEIVELDICYIQKRPAPNLVHTTSAPVQHVESTSFVTRFDQIENLKTGSLWPHFDHKSEAVPILS